MQAEFTITIPNWASNTGRRIFVPVGIFAAHEKRVFESTQRIHPIYFDYPSSEWDDLTIELPTKWHAIAVPKPRAQEGISIVYRMNVEDNRTTLHITRQLDNDIFTLEQKHYAALREFFQRVRSSDEEQIVLQPTETTVTRRCGGTFLRP